MAIKRTPSSLDYEALLHELALTNWRRAILACDFSRALSNAETLARSRDRFWRWQGLVDLATTHLCFGSTSESLLHLSSARRVFPDVPSFDVAPLETEAHLWLDARSSPAPVVAPRESSADSDSDSDSDVLRYHRGRALARLGRRDEALDVAGSLAERGGRFGLSLSGHVRAEVALAAGRRDEAEAALRAALGAFSEPERKLGSTPAAPLLYALARELGSSDRDEALLLFDEVAEMPDALFHWPVFHVRSHHERGALRRSRGDASGARSSFEKFLLFWGRSDVAGEDVGDALQFVNA
jgi:tetratricopeptide (TPR) repeat protein